MTQRYPLLYRSIQILALLLVGLTFLFPFFINEGHYVLALALILFGGIPHGATDYVIFRHLRRPGERSRKLLSFLMQYILVMGVYALLWWLSPLVGLLIFLAISVFHFGQSNWNYLEFRSNFERQFTYYLWGALVLFFPIIWHFEQALPIIEAITGPLGLIPHGQIQTWLSLGLLGANVGWLCYLYATRQLSLPQGRDEVINLLVLVVAYIQLPLLLGFAVYFVAWHSLSSILDQIRFYNQQAREPYDWRAYLRDVWPFSLLAIGSVGGWLAWQYSLQAQIDWAGLFIFISVVTLPHMLLIDRLYGRREEERLTDAKISIRENRLDDKKMIKTL